MFVKRHAPIVSIVTPSYQQARFLEANLSSIRAQSYSSIEHVIQDGGSSDGTIELLRASTARWVSEPDTGQTNALNKAIAAARGEIIGWVNSDDYLYPDAVRLAVAALDETGADAVYGRCSLVDEAGRHIGSYRTETFSYERLVLRNIIGQPAVFFRRSMYERCGTFDERLDFAMDYEYWLRCARESRFVHVPDLFAAYRIHGASKTVRSAMSHASEANALRRRYGRGVVPAWRLLIACGRTSLGGLAKSNGIGLRLVRRFSWRRNP